MLLKPKHASRYKDLALLLARHHRLVRAPGAECSDAESCEDAVLLAEHLEQLGPTFVKLGQLLSTRADLLPEPYLQALARLQDKVEPFAFEHVERIVEAELGVRLNHAFDSFDETPLASASLGQVHRARLRSGRHVAVKVQRPNIHTQVLGDMDAIASIAEFADEHTGLGRRLGFAGMVGEFRRSLLAELDYEQEARNLEQLRANLTRRSRIVVPEPIRDYSTARVLTMDFVAGKTIGSIGPLGLVDLDGRELAAELFGAYLDQILVDGFFHADPHPGNMLVTEDGRLALIDIGMVARVEPAMREQLIKLLVAAADGHANDAVRVTMSIGRQLDDFDLNQFSRQAAELIGRNRDSTMRDLQVGMLVADLTRVAGACGLRLPSELTMLGKTLLNLDESVRLLDPDFNPRRALESEMSDLMRRNILGAASTANAVKAALEVKELAEHLPRQLHQIMETLALGELSLNVRGIDEREIMRSTQKLANRVTTGVIVASLVIGAGLIMRVPTHTRLFGYPALAIVLFLVAAAAAISVLITIHRSDLPQRRRRRRRGFGQSP